jgi:hypothetical protein
MATIQDAVKEALTGPVDPAFLKTPPVPPEEMSGVYREIFLFFAASGTPMVRRSGTPSPCSQCGGQVIKIQSEVPGAIRYDGCCVNCGKDEFHRVGWTDGKIRDEYRAKSGSLEVSP